MLTALIVALAALALLVTGLDHPLARFVAAVTALVAAVLLGAMLQRQDTVHLTNTARRTP